MFEGDGVETGTGSGEKGERGLVFCLGGVDVEVEGLEGGTECRSVVFGGLEPFPVGEGGFEGEAAVEMGFELFHGETDVVLDGEVAKVDVEEELGVVGAGELAGDLGEEEVDGVGSGAVEGPGVVEADVGVEGWGGEDDVAPGAGDEGEGREEGGGEVHGELEDAGEELGRDGVDEGSGGEEESATGGEGGKLGSEGSDFGVEIDDVSWSRTGITIWDWVRKGIRE